MGLTINDLMIRAKTVGVADGDAISGPCRIFAIGIYHTSIATLTINNAATKAGGGTTVVVGCPSNGAGSFDFGPTGVYFDTGLSVAISAGSGWVSYIEEAV